MQEDVRTNIRLRPIALSFDDGPCENTAELLDILKENGAKATFFSIGRNVNGYEDVLKRAFLEGHEIANHSFTHPPLSMLSREELTAELQNTSNAIRDAIGTPPTLLRPPYGDCGGEVTAVATELSLSIIRWSLDTADWRDRDSDIVSQRILDNVREGDIILCHETHRSTIEAIRDVLPILRARGFKVCTVSGLFDKKGIMPKAGSAYSRA